MRLIPLIAVLVWSSAACAADADALRYFRIGTGSAAGTDFTIGQAIAAVISSPPGAPPCDARSRCGVPGLIAVAETTGTAQANFDRVESGLLSAALVRTDLLSRREDLGGLRYVGSLYEQNFYLVAQRFGAIESPADLAGKRVAIGRPGSGTRLAAELVLDAYGIKLTTFEPVREDPGRAADMLAAGELDAFFFVGGQPALIISKLAEQKTIRLVPLKGGAMERLSILFRSYNRTKLTKDAYGLDAETETIGVVTGLIVNADADAELVYAITKALWAEGNRQHFSTVAPGLAAFDAMRALEGAPIELHPGAERYYTEIGLIEPAVQVEATGSQP